MLKCKWVLYTIGGILGFIVVLTFLEAFKPEWFYTEVRKNLNFKKCANNLHDIGLGLIMCAQDNDGKFPDKLSVLYPDYISEVEKFFYPEEKKETMTPENIDSFGYFECVSGLTLDDDPDTVLACERPGNLWRNEVYVDGHLKACSEEFRYIKEAGDVVNNYEQKVISGDKVVINHARDIMWQQSGSDSPIQCGDKDSGSPILCGDVKRCMEDINTRGYAGYNDWRLPNQEESGSLIEPVKKNGNLYIDPVFDKTQNRIWIEHSGVEGDLCLQSGHMGWVGHIAYIRPCTLNEMIQHGIASTPPPPNHLQY